MMSVVVPQVATVIRSPAVRDKAGYLLIIIWSIAVSLIVDVVSGGRTYPVEGGPDAFSRAVGTTWIGWVLLFVLRDVRTLRQHERADAVVV